MRTIIITGAGGGLGLHLSLALMHAFPDEYFVLQYRNRGAEVLAKVLTAEGLIDRVTLFGADLEKDFMANGLVEAAHVNGQRQLWGVVNLAGGNTNKMLGDVSGTEFLCAFSQNVITAHNVNRAACEVMRRGEEGGRIVNISSVVAKTGAAGASPYAAAKAAVEGYTRSLALEVARHRITVNCLALGYFTDGLISQVPEDKVKEIIKKTALRRLGDPGLELASGVRFLLGDDAGFVTGQVIGVNGGLA